MGFLVVCGLWLVLIFTQFGLVHKLLLTIPQGKELNLIGLHYLS